MSNTFIQEAFKNSYLLEDAEEFSLNVSGPDDTESFLDIINAEDENEMISDVYDLEAEAKEDLKQSYIGKVILDCNVCHSNVFFDKDEVTEDEDGNCCIDVECPYCMSNEGYTIIGEVKPYQEEEEVDLADVETEEVPDEEPLDVDEEPAEDIDAEPIKDEEEGLEESLKANKNLREELDIDDLEEDEFYEDVDGNMWNVFEVDWDYDIVRASTYPDGDETREFGIDEFCKLINESLEKFTEGLKADKVKELKRSDRLDGQKGLGRGKGLEASDEIRGPKYKELKEALEDSKDKFLEIMNADTSWSYEDIYNFLLGFISDDAKEEFDKFETTLGKNDPDELVYWLLDNMSDEEIERAIDTVNEYNEFSEGRLEECGTADKLEECGEADKLEEGIEDVQITTEDETMTMSTKEDGGVVIETSPKEEEFAEDEFIEEPIEEEPIEGGEEMIAPIEPETEAEIEDVIDPEEEAEDEGDFEELGDFEEFDEESFDSLGESYLKRCYENVTSFKTSNISLNENKEYIIEGKIGFDSGNEKNTQFIFSPKTNENGKLKLEGYNKQISKGKKTFKLNCSINDKAIVCESLNYNYKGKNDLNESVRVYGTVKRKK